MDYVKAMGMGRLSSSTDCGFGVRVAVLDSGIPYWSCPGVGTADVFGHATAVSSILFGARGIAGMCVRATQLYVKVLDDEGRGSVASVSDGILEAVDLGADVINLSLGFMRTDKCPSPLERACESAYSAGSTVVCAAGNDGGPVNWPAALKTTICVGSESKNGLKTPFSSFGEVDFVAPGQNLPVIDTWGRVRSVSGTSFSAALVSGAAALLIADMRKTCGGVCGVTPDGVRDALRCLTIDIGAPGWDADTGYGIVFGGKQDPTVGMVAEKGFFGRMFEKAAGLLCGIFGKRRA